MRKIGYESVKLATGAAVAALAAGVAVAAPVPALASPAASAPARAAQAASAPALAPVAVAPGPERLRLAPLAVAPGPKRLKAALLAAGDLPVGYLPMISNTGLSTMVNLNTDTDLCDHRPGTRTNVHKAESAGISFIRTGGGPLLFENLTATGPELAGAVVAGLAAAPRVCPTLKVTIPTSGETTEFALTPLRVPRLGDGAAGVAFTVRLASVNMTVHGKIIAVAYRDVALSIMLIGVPQTTPREVGAIVTAAVRKLQRNR